MKRNKAVIQNRKKKLHYLLEQVPISKKNGGKNGFTNALI